MAAKSKKWKSLKAATSGFLKAAHDQAKPELSARLTTWTAHGHLEKDPLTPLLGRPLEQLRVRRLKDAKPLKVLAQFPNLKVLWFEDCDVDAQALVEAAQSVATLEALMVWSRKSASPLGAAQLGGLSKLQVLELRGTQLADDGIAALFGGKTLVEVSLARSGSEEQKKVTIEDQPALRRLDLNLTVGALRLARLPALEELDLGGSFEELTVEEVPLVDELDLCIGASASLRGVGAKKIIGTGLTSFELSDAPKLQTLDLRGCEALHESKQLEGLRKAFPRAKVLPS